MNSFKYSSMYVHSLYVIPFITVAEVQQVCTEKQFELGRLSDSDRNYIPGKSAEQFRLYYSDSGDSVNQ